MTELGKRLEEARKQKNLTLDELQAITKIQKRYLQAIETGNYDAMPGKFYARAFIKQYAEAVNLDPEKLFEEYASEVPKTETEVTNGISRSQKKQTAVSSTSSFLLSLLPKLLIVVLVISVVVFIWLFFQNQDLANNSEGETGELVVESEEDENITIVNPEEVKDEKDQELQPETEVKEPEEKAPAEPTIVQQLTQIEQKDGNSPTTTFELKGTDQFNVELISNGRSYVGVENGMGKSFFAQELAEGGKFTYDFSGEQEIELNIGRTLDVIVKINGQVVEYPYQPSEKVHQKIKILFNNTSTSNGINTENNASTDTTSTDTNSNNENNTNTIQ